MAFVPRFIFASELKAYGLPSQSEQDDIMSLVEGASVLIDEHCARIDSDGNGSLVYTTYTERLHLPQGRNVVRLTYRPLAAIPESVRVDIAASGDRYYTGFKSNGVVRTPGSVLSPIVSLSGRYGYGRRGEQQVYPDLNYGANILQVASYFGGPPQYTPVDIGFVDFNTQVAEIWIPAGLYLSQYTEIEVMYNSGFDPRDMPSAIKQATANVTKNSMIRGGGMTGLQSITGVGKIGTSFTEELIDPTTKKLLRSYVTTIAI